MSHRTEKFASTLKHALAEILLFEMDNAQLKSVSVTSVSVSPDLKSAQVLVSSFLPNADQVIDDLIKAKGHIKGLLAKKMYMRYIPELHFIKDSGFEMDQALARMNKEKKHE